MPEEIKYIDNSPIPKLNEETINNEIRPIESSKKEDEPPKTTKKVILPSWNIEPPVEIQRNIE